MANNLPLASTYAVGVLPSVQVAGIPHLSIMTHFKWKLHDNNQNEY